MAGRGIFIFLKNWDQRLGWPPSTVRSGELCKKAFSSMIQINSKTLWKGKRIPDEGKKTNPCHSQCSVLVTVISKTEGHVMIWSSSFWNAYCSLKLCYPDRNGFFWIAFYYSRKRHFGHHPKEKGKWAMCILEEKGYCSIYFFRSWRWRMFSFSNAVEI